MAQVPSPVQGNVERKSTCQEWLYALAAGLSHQNPPARLHAAHRRKHAKRHAELHAVRLLRIGRKLSFKDRHDFVKLRLCDYR